MIVALYKPRRLQRFIGRFARACGARVVEWEGNCPTEGLAKLDFPAASEYTTLMEASRAAMAGFFSETFASRGCAVADTYLRKLYDLQYLDYYAFREQLKRSYADAGKVVPLGGGYNKRIYDGRKRDDRFPAWRFPIYLLLSFGTLLLYWLRSYLCALFYGGTRGVTEVLYLRKKAYPDLGMKAQLAGHLAKAGVECTGVYTTFSRKREAFDFYYLNAIAGFRSVSLVALRKSLGQIAAVAWTAAANGISRADTAALVKEMYVAACVTHLGAKVMVGVLVDKPLFSILSFYTNDRQKIMAINESFFYPPFRSFDYVNSDVYFSMNDIDASMQNKYGGEIGSFHSVEFIRNSLQSTSQGLSQEIQVQIAAHDKTVVVTTMQVSDTGYTQWGKEELDCFIRGALDIAQANPRYLVVVKGKKNELSKLDSTLRHTMQSLSNVFVINSVKPRLLKYDQFEDLLGVADLIVSMSHTSTTIWQAVARGIPVVAINDAHPSSFLATYPYLESKSSAAAEACQHWLAMNEDARKSFLSELRERVNIGNSGGLQQIADYVARTLAADVDQPGH